MQSTSMPTMSKAHEVSAQTKREAIDSNLKEIEDYTY
jgi:hypothetical protein